MAVPTTIQLSIARTQAEKLLTASATHHIKSVATSASGSEIDTYTPQQTALTCLCYLSNTGKAVSSEVATIGGKEADIGTHAIRLPHGTSITRGDRLIIGGSTFEVVTVGDSDTNKILLIVGAKRVR